MFQPADIVGEKLTPETDDSIFALAENLVYQDEPEDSFYLDAIELLRGLISRDSPYPAALNLMGKMRLEGLGVEKDIKMSVELFQQAHNLGNVSATHNLALCYRDGCGVEQNFDQAIELFKSAAERGTMKSAWELGTLFDPDHYLHNSNLEKAKHWYKIAAVGGKYHAQVVGGYYQAQYDLADILNAEKKYFDAYYFATLATRNKMATKEENKEAAELRTRIYINDYQQNGPESELSKAMDKGIIEEMHKRIVLPGAQISNVPLDLVGFTLG